MSKLKEHLLKHSPEIVLAPWPLDVHPDHQAAGILAWQAFLDRRFNFDLYFYETTNMPHTKTFSFDPNVYVDVSGAMDKKREALYKHESQMPKLWFGMYETMATFRGYESGIQFAEAYIKARYYSSAMFRGYKPGVAERIPEVRKVLKEK